MLQLAATLNLLGGGGYQRQVGADWAAPMGQSTVAEISAAVIKRMQSVLCPLLIKFEPLDSTKEHFSEKYKIPGGDSGYPLEPFLLTPYRNANENSRELNFNFIHSQARSIVERCIGRLKTYTVASDDFLTLSPSTDKVVRFTNESHIVLCNAPTDLKIHWKSPKGDIMKDVKGRIHIEEKTPGQLALIFVHIALSDKGNWMCEDADGTANANKSFNLVVYQKISFTENATILTVKEGKNATILCEVKGDPEPTVSWQLNGQPIEFSASSKFRKLADGLLIHKVTQNDTGEYTCKAYQFTKDISDVQERTVLMKIEHKPFWTHKSYANLLYGYLGGRTSISCEAIAEPPANFTWYRNKKRLHSNKHIIHNEPYLSTLVIDIKDETLYDTYKCVATNSQGSIERTTQLEKGTKPPPPSHLQLRGFNSNTFDVDVGSVRTTSVRNLMDVNGFRIEFMTDYEFKSAAGNWSYAKRKDFPFEDGATFLIGNLEHNTTYLMRAASKNLAGLSDWTKVEKFTTLSIEPPSGGPRSVSLLSALETLCIAIAVIVVSNVRPTGAANTRGRIISISHGL